VLRVGGDADVDGLREGARSGGGQKERLGADRRGRLSPRWCCWCRRGC
jgi:hypothetical protein